MKALILLLVCYYDCMVGMSMQEFAELQAARLREQQEVRVATPPPPPKSQQVCKRMAALEERMAQLSSVVDELRREADERERHEQEQGR